MSVIHYSPGPPPLILVTPSGYEIHISQGQSWRDNVFKSFGYFNLNPNATLAFLVKSIGSPTFAPGPLPNSAGINLSGLPAGITNYSSSDQISIGRCAVLAHQLLCIQDNPATLKPTAEFCAGFPGSTWTSGGGGGLGPGSTFTGSITNDVLTILAPGTGATNINQSLATLSGPSLDPATVTVTANEDGTFVVGKGQVVANAQMTASNGAVFIASITNGQAGNGTQLAISQIISGSIGLNTTITAGAPLANTQIMSLISGTSGGIGVYQLQVGSQQTVASAPMQSFALSWNNMLKIIAAAEALLPSGPYSTPLFKSFGYTQGGSSTGTTAGKESDLTQMLTLMDAMNLPGTDAGGLRYYIGVAAAISTATSYDVSDWGSYTFCRTNAPGQGGPWSGRCFLTTPWHQWPFSGPNDPAYGNIHTGPYGTVRHGEIEGYAKWLAQKKGIPWTPLWPSLAQPITVSGQTVTIPFDRPPGPDFANAAMTFQASPNDGIKVWPQYGFQVMRNGSALTVAPTINGTNVSLSITETLSAGDVLEVSYAWYGPGGTNPGLGSGVGGNLVMNGPPSILFPGQGLFIGSWCPSFLYDITV